MDRRNFFLKSSLVALGMASITKAESASDPEGGKKKLREKNMDMMIDQTPTDPGFYFGWYDLNQEQFRDIFFSAYEGELQDMQSETWR